MNARSPARARDMLRVYHAGSSALPVSHFVNPLLVHRSSIRIRTEGEERRATLSFSFDCLVPCSVRVYWGVPLKPLLWQLAAASEAEAPASEALEAKKPDEESEDLEMEPLRPPGRDDTDAEAERGLVARELGLLRPCEFTSVCSEERLSPGRVLQYVSRPHECPLLADRTDAWSPLCIAFHYPSTALGTRSARPLCCRSAGADPRRGWAAGGGGLPVVSGRVRGGPAGAAPATG
jgi:hypothetical protein